MKTRTGFVSNSSSTSFLVARDPDKPIKIVVEIPVKENSYTKPIHTIEELDAEFEENYDHFQVRLKAEPDSRIAKKYNKCRAAIEAGKELVWISGSNEDNDAVSQLVYYGLGDATFLGGEEIVDTVPK